MIQYGTWNLEWNGTLFYSPSPWTNRALIKRTWHLLLAFFPFNHVNHLGKSCTVNVHMDLVHNCSAFSRSSGGAKLILESSTEKTDFLLVFFFLFFLTKHTFKCSYLSRWLTKAFKSPSCPKSVSLHPLCFLIAKSMQISGGIHSLFCS